MSQNSIRSRLRRAAWQITPAPILHLVFGARLRGMGRLIGSTVEHLLYRMPCSVWVVAPEKLE